jgi:hypothetical protein
MNRKQLTLVIVLGLVLGGAGLYQYLQRQQSTRDTRMGAKLLGTNFDVNAVAALSIRTSSNVLNVAKTGDLWTVKERGDYPANFTTIADFLGKLAGLKIVKPVEVGPSRLPVLQLLPPDKNGPGVLVELKDAAGKPVKTLLLGKQTMKEGRGGPMGDTGWPDGRYVMVDNKTEAIALVSDALTQAEPKPEDWISKDFIKVEKLKAVSVTSTNATNNWKLVRDTETTDWKLADAKGDEKADSGKCSGLNFLLQSPSFDDLALGWKFDATNKPTTTATVETFEGFTYAVELANKPGGENYYFHVAVTADLPKQRTPGKDEKPEDKDKLDKEFKDKNQKLQDKLKTEKTYEKWTYVVSKWTVDNLFKERKDFLAEKITNAPPALTNAVPATTNAVPATTNAAPATTNAPVVTIPVPPPATNPPVVVPPKTNAAVVPPARTNTLPPLPPPVPAKTNAPTPTPPAKTNAAVPAPTGQK